MVRMVKKVIESLADWHHRGAWWWWSSLWGLVGLAVLPTAVVVYLTERQGPVIIATGPVQHVSQRVPIGGQLSYTLDFVVLEACPGEVVSLYRSLDDDQPRLVTQRRPASFDHTGSYPGTPISRTIPSELTPGRWAFTAYRESNCLTRRVNDQFARFEFEVVAGDPSQPSEHP
jgi:hypothetical protein